MGKYAPKRSRRKAAKKQRRANEALKWLLKTKRANRRPK